MTTTTTFRAGDVVSYTPARTWTREGTAVARELAGAVVLVDTFWGSALDGSTLDCHVVTDDKAATATVLFNVADWRAWDDHRDGGPGACWSDFHPDDRQVITSQHGIQRVLFVRPGAVPDHATKVAKARAEVERCEQQVRSAHQALDWARQDLEALLTAHD